MTPSSSGVQQEFRQHLSVTYGSSLETTTTRRSTIIGDRTEAAATGRCRPRSCAAAATNDIPVDYRLRQINGQWKIIDFIIEQVSLVANFRSQFQEIVGNGGPEHLLKVLREKNAAGEPLKS